LVVALLVGLAGCRTELPPEPSQQTPDSIPQVLSSGDQGEWKSTGRMAGARLLHTATLLPNGRVLATGGYNHSAELYDPATGTWSRTADVLDTHRAASATLLSNGRVLIAGFGGSSGISAELYDPATGSWARTGAMRTPRFYHTATLLPEGRVLVVGGADGEYGGRVLATAEVYDPATGVWTQTGSLGKTRRDHTATLLAGGKVLVTGGTDAAGVLQGSAEVYDPATGTWSPVGAMAVARTYHSATLLADGRVLVVGGAGSDPDRSASAEVYDPATGTWSTTGRLGKPRRYHSATLLPTARVLVVGGYHDATGILTSAEVYDPSSGAWSSAGNMAADRYQHTATLLEGGRVLVVGGVSNADAASAELYTTFYTPEPGPPVGPEVEPVGTSLLVQVVDPSRMPISGATVTVAGSERSTDVAGNALFEGLAPGSYVAQVRAPGFATGTVASDLEQGVHGGAVATLRPLSPPIAFNADTDATITTTQVQVSIPAGSLVDDNGQPVSGSAEIVFGPIDPTTDDIESAPGPLVAIAADGEEVGLDSGFMADISLVQNGRQLQLAPGATASVTFALPPDFAATVTPGELIPAWWFDTEAGIWREDGIGVVEESPTEPGKLIWTVEVSHFTSWNCDRPWRTQSCTNVLVTDQNGNPLSGRSVTARGLSYRYQRTLTTGSNGRVCLPVMRYGRAQIYVGSSQSPQASTVITPTVSARCGSSSCTPVTLTVATPCGAPGTVQTCAYTGPSGTNGVGACRAGYRVCNGYSWSACSGQVTPTTEVCNNSIDEDCDGQRNDGCPGVCTNGSTQSCYTGPAGTSGVGQCKAGSQTCVNGAWGACTGEVKPASSERCGNTSDDDCDGMTNEGCVCNPGDSRTCYTGPAGTSGVGQCKSGTETCYMSGSSPFWGACTGQATPTSEACDGLDNNCDGQRDEGSPGSGASCSTGQPGVCAAGTTTCGSGALVCRPNTPSSAEVCDGLDNDCDGMVDDGNPGAGASCSTGRPGVCAAGSTVCSGGTLSCNAATSPTAEVCDGLDNDCDGVVDEGNPGGGTSCSTGRPGVCEVGTTVCSGGTLSCNATTSPTAEVCDSLDNDCDGVVNNGNPGGGASCSTGQLGVCAVGTTVCGGGTLSCRVTKSPTEEVCDGLDNDCDGKVDENNPGGGAACSTGQPGVCSTGTTTCSGGALVCTAKTSPTAEACGDNQDNDCDGETDEGCTSGSFDFEFTGSNTNSATQNTTDRVVVLSAGQSIEVGTCNMPGAVASGDTYLRLFSPFGTQVAQNDDSCASASSYLTYTVPAGQGGTYTIKAGCFSNTACSGKVVGRYN